MRSLPGNVAQDRGRLESAGGDPFYTDPAFGIAHSMGDNRQRLTELSNCVRTGGGNAES